MIKSEVTVLHDKFQIGEGGYWEMMESKLAVLHEKRSFNYSGDSIGGVGRIILR